MTLAVEVEFLLSVWKRDATIFLVVGYGLVALGILSSLAVGVFSDHLRPLHQKIVAFVAAACTALLASFSPLQISRNYADAWVVLYQAKVGAIVKGANANPEDLQAAMKEGEKIIARNPVAALPSS